MSDADATSSKAVIAGAEPQLFVADIKSSCDFFTRKLGFVIAFTYGERSSATARGSTCAASSSR